MFEFHKNKSKYFNWQFRISDEYIFPFVKDFIKTEENLSVLEIGCAEAGVLKAFTNRNHTCTGIELNANRVELAKEFMKEELEAGKIQFVAKNIYDIKEGEEWKFDLVILKDVIEHIPDQARFIKQLHMFLKEGGKVFFGFPPWYMPFGGHQQICRSKILSKLPYYHLLPKFLYKFLLKAFGEPKNVVSELLEIKDLGISIERFEKIVKKEKYKILNKKLFLTNPIYQFKFGLKVRPQNGFIGSIPFFRNFLTTCAYYVIEKDS